MVFNISAQPFSNHVLYHCCTVDTETLSYELSKGTHCKNIINDTFSFLDEIELTQPGSGVVRPGASLVLSCKVSGYSLTDNSYATGWI